MQALIIAAGFGSRLSERSTSKPLAKVCGVSLIELSIRQARRVGIRDFVVVTGHQANALESALEEIAERLSVAINPVRLEDWSRPNGYSVIAGAAHIEGQFLLMMADHIFSIEILEHLIRADMKGLDTVLAIDRRLNNPVVDPDDATWVQTDAGGKISAIGKHIEGYDAVDCGAFLANHELPAAIESAIADGKPGSLSEGMQILAQAGSAGTMDIGHAWWIDVDDPASQDLAEAQLADHIDLHPPALPGPPGRYSGKAA